MPSPHEVNMFQQIITRLAELARAEAAALWHRVHDEDDVADIYPHVLDPHIGASALITSAWYDSLSDKPFAVRPAPPPPLHTMDYKARWAAAQPDPATALADASDRFIFNASRDTVISNAEREDCGFARHASANACPWCAVLATRGSVYHTAEAAIRSHDNCHCIAVPNREGNYYLEPPYVDEWRQEYNAARKETGSKDMDVIVNAMRRNRRAAETKTYAPVGA